MTFTVYSSRIYGEPKLPKPEPLNGIRQSFSEVFIYNKCSFPVFVLKDADQVWIKSRDWFSPMFQPPDPSDDGKPLQYIVEKYFPDQKPPSEKFTYANNYASVVLRCEAWICFSGIFREVDEYNGRKLFTKPHPMPIWLRENMIRCVEETLELQLYDLTCSDLERFFERVIARLEF